MNKKNLYRITLATLAVLAIAGALFSYAGHTVNMYYHQEASHLSDLIWIALFFVAFVGFSIEAVILVVFDKIRGESRK